MNWIKQNWIKVGIGMMILVVLFLVKGKNNNSSISPSPTFPPTSTDEADTLSYEMVYPDLKNDVKRVYGKNLLETKYLSLFWDKTAEPPIVNEGNYKITFAEFTEDSKELKVFDKNKLLFTEIADPLDLDEPLIFTDLIISKYNSASYYLVEGMSGGAHCCLSYLPIVINDKGIKIGKRFYIGHGIGIDYDFFIKDGKVYIWMPNSNFAYFLSSYLSSKVAFYPSFFRIDATTGNLIPSDNEFRTFYSQFIDEKSVEVEKLKKENFDGDTFYKWESVLVARTIYQLKAGQSKDTVMKQFDSDFRILKEKYGISDFIYFPYVEDYKKDVAGLAGVNSEYIMKHGLPDAWYATGGLEKIKQDIVEVTLGK